MKRNNKTNFKGNKKPTSPSEDTNGDLMPYQETKQIQQPVVEKEVTQAVPQFICVYCNGPHKFSPFNVKKTAENVPKEFVFRRTPESTMYVVTIVSKAKEQNFEALTSDIIASNGIKASHVVFWSDGINVFDNGCLIALIVNKHQHIDCNTIVSLLSAINCSKWWEDLLIAVAESDPLNDSITRAKTYLIWLKDCVEEKAQHTLKDYVFKRFGSRLRTLEDIKQRENEKIAVAALEEQERQREADKIKRQAEDEAKIIATREQMLMNAVIYEKTAIENFTDILNTARKTHDSKYIAAINPEGNVIADLTMKLGEKSNLQEGINLDTMKRKYKVFKFYTKQEELKKAGKIKFKKSKWTSKTEKMDDNIIPEIPEVTGDVNNPWEELKLSKTQLLQYEAAFKEYEKLKVTGLPPSSIILDNWQSLSIGHIGEGNNCLITGPTAGGKTYVMFAGLLKIISENEGTVVMVSPTFHLAYQTYANVKATFPSKNVAIITSELIHIPKGANILIGSAAELLNYFVTKNLNFQVGIFDEIHVASNAYCDESSIIEKIRARSYARLLARCEKQVIAASATLVNEDGMRSFIAGQMNQIRAPDKQLTIEDIKLVKYDTRSVPLQEYRFNNESIVPIVRDANGVDQTLTTESTSSVEIDSKNMFKLLVQMRDRDMTPTIVFEQTDDLAWNTYSTFVDYIESMEQRDYECYNEMVEIINKNIDSFNLECETKLDEVPENDITDATRIRAGAKGNDKRDSVLRSIKKLRTKALQDIVNESKTFLVKSIINFNVQKPECLCTITKDNLPREDLKAIRKYFDESNSAITKSSKFIVSQAHVDMVKLINTFEESNGEQAEKIARVTATKGSSFKFAKSQYCIELFDAMRNPGSDEEKWKHRKRMLALADAQNIHPKDIDGITDVILRGLNFGIAIISNSLPFVVQNIVLESLKKKDLGVVFAAESMSMGINFPLRSVVIKGYRGNCTINPGKIIQMAGRCGRRGMDSQAHVIYYGVDNAHEAHYRFIPPVSYPNDFYLDESLDNTGSTISNYSDFAKELGEIFLTKYFKSIVTQATPTKAIYSKNGGREKEYRKSANGRDNGHNNHGYVHEERADDMREIATMAELAEKESQSKRSEYLKPTLLLLCKAAKFSNEQAEEIANMVCNLDESIIDDSYRINSFKKSQDIKVLMNMMIELYNHYAISSHNGFLDFIEYIMIVLRSCSNKLIKYAK